MNQMYSAKQKRLLGNESRTALLYSTVSQTEIIPVDGPRLLLPFGHLIYFHQRNTGRATSARDLSSVDSRSQRQQDR